MVQLGFARLNYAFKKNWLDVQVVSEKVLWSLADTAALKFSQGSSEN